MDAETLKIVLGALTPIGVLVVVVAWALISRRNGNGQYQVVVAKLDALRYDMTEIKTDVRKLRSSLVRHLEDHTH
jgi:sensor domain CHASE-containing protein